MNAVEAGLRLVFAVAGQVEREDSESVRGFRGRRWDLYVLSRQIKKQSIKLLRFILQYINKT